jgi:hypothetical protein
VKITGGDEFAFPNSRRLRDGAVFVEVGGGIIDDNEGSSYAVQVIVRGDNRADIPFPKEKGDVGGG